MENKQARDWLIEHTRNYVPFCDVEALDLAIKSLGNSSPCDLCVHNPPSIYNGKPCATCPAEPKESEEE